MCIVVSVEIDRKHVLLSWTDVVICSTPCKRKWWSAWKHLLHRFCWKKAAGKAAFFHEPNLWYSNCYLKRISNYAYLSRRLQIFSVWNFFGRFLASFVRILLRADVAQLVEHFTRNEGVIGSSPTRSFIIADNEPNGNWTLVHFVCLLFFVPKLLYTFLFFTSALYS